MTPSESLMPLIAFLLFTHARLQDNACAMSHDSYVSSNLLCNRPRHVGTLNRQYMYVHRVCEELPKGHITRYTYRQMMPRTGWNLHIYNLEMMRGRRFEPA